MNLVFVSAGLVRPKKADTRVARRHRYLNYGLLSLASSDAAPAASVFHGHFDDPAVTFERIKAMNDPSQPCGFLISCPSFLALDWAARFVRLVRSTYDQATILFGGRWVVDHNVERLALLVPGVDRFVEGLGEGAVRTLFKECLGVDYEPAPTSGSVFGSHGLSFLDYAKLDRPEEFVPSFEVSRGCGAGCAFCSEAKVKLSPMKPPAILCEEVCAYRSVVAEPVSRFYLESSLFVPRRDWIEGWIEARRGARLEDVAWRTEGRVDMFTEHSVELLARSGLAVLDLGLESASRTQLQRMRKTPVPDEYLRRAEKLLRAASAAGIMTKVNILLFPGETRQSIEETQAWLEPLADHITGVSVYPTIYYGFDRDRDPMWSYYESLGATAAPERVGTGITMMNLSEQIDWREAERIAGELSAAFMNAAAYYRLKSFSYFDPRYQYDDYAEDLAADAATLESEVQAGEGSGQRSSAVYADGP